MTERTLVLIKPDGVQRLLVGRVPERYESRGLKIVALKLMQADRALAEEHYAVHRERPFFAGLVEFITSAPLVAVALEARTHRGHPYDQRCDPTPRGGAGLDPRRPRAGDRAEPSPRVGQR